MADYAVSVVDGQIVVQPFGSGLITPLVAAAEAARDDAETAQAAAEAAQAAAEAAATDMDGLDARVTAAKLLADDMAPASKNLFNKNTATSGYLVNNSTGNNQAASGYTASDYIPVTAGVTYVAPRGSYGAWYTADRTYISGFNGANAVDYNMTAPSGAVWLRVTVNTALVATASYQLEVGTVSTAFTPYGAKLAATAVTDNTISGAGLQNGSVSPAKFSAFSASKNLFNRATATSGYLVNNSTGNNQAASGYTASDFMPVTAGVTYVMRIGSYGAWYTAAQVYISGFNGSNAADYNATAPTGAAFCRCTVNEALVAVADFQFEAGTVGTTYENWAYGMDPNVAKVKSRWHGLLLGLLGDSITANDGWSKHISGEHGLLTLNYGVAGSLLSGAGGSTTAMCQTTRINAMSASLDAVHVLAGMNDFVQNVALGSYGSTNPLEFYGALETCVSNLLARYPAKRVIFGVQTFGQCPATYVAKGWANAYTNTQGLTPADYAAATRRVCAAHGIPVIDYNGEAGWGRHNASSFVADESGDFIHPKAEGKARMGALARARFRELEPVI